LLYFKIFCDGGSSIQRALGLKLKQTKAVWMWRTKNFINKSEKQDQTRFFDSFSAMEKE
jgi:hypothetical protein